MDICFRPQDIPHRVRQWCCGIAEGPPRSEVALLTTFFRPRLIAALEISFFLVAAVGGLLAAALAG